MGLSSWKDKYRYQGAEWPLEQFVEIAGEVLDRLGIDERSVPNDRLVRYYTGEGAMRKPGREGREARYTWEHLVEFLVTRMLLKDGWPLSKISQFMSSSDTHSLEQMLPSEPMTPAEREVRAIKRSMKRPVDDDVTDASASMMEPRLEPPAIARRVVTHNRPMIEEQSLRFDEAELFEQPASPSASQKMLDLQGSMARGRSSLSHLLHSIGFGKHRPEWKETASIDLTPWCTVTFDAEQLRRLPHAAFDPLGEALAQSLREHRLATRRERK
jgi:DNA-binding transcriptional MerR regulator